MSESTKSISPVYLSLVLLALVLVGCLAVRLLGALLLALVPVAAAAPPEPQLGALLPPLLPPAQAVPRPLATPPGLGQDPHSQHRQHQQPEIVLQF